MLPRRTWPFSMVSSRTVSSPMPRWADSGSSRRTGASAPWRPRACIAATSPREGTGMCRQDRHARRASRRRDAGGAPGCSGRGPASRRPGQGGCTMGRGRPRIQVCPGTFPRSDRSRRSRRATRQCHRPTESPIRTAVTPLARPARRWLAVSCDAAGRRRSRGLGHRLTSVRAAEAGRSSHRSLCPTSPLLAQLALATRAPAVETSPMVASESGFSNWCPPSRVLHGPTGPDPIKRAQPVTSGPSRRPAGPAFFRPPRVLGRRAPPTPG